MDSVGVVGCGYVGTRHAILFDKLDGIRLEAVCDVDG
jgi:predicted dehydrogenase